MHPPVLSKKKVVVFRFLKYDSIFWEYLLKVFDTLGKKGTKVNFNNALLVKENQPHDIKV